MLEVLALVLLVVFVLVIFVAYFLRREKLVLEDAKRTIVSAREKIGIAERKFLQGRIKKNVFDSILDDLEKELISAELALFRYRKAPTLSVGDKVDEVATRLGKPTKHRRAKITRILRDTELLREELGVLEAKFLRREIKQSVFDRLVKEKEAELIQKEKDLMDVVTMASVG